MIYSFDFFQVCSNTSSNYEAFSLDSPLISSISPTGRFNFTKGREISVTNPITIPSQNTIQSIIVFPTGYQVMEVILVTQQPLQTFNVRIGDDKTTLDASVVSSITGSFEYVVTIPPELIQPTEQITIIVFTSVITDITSFTIKACTGKLFWICLHRQRLFSFSF